MKTYEVVKSMATGEKKNLGSSPVGGCLVRKTRKGVLASNSNGDFYVKDAGIEKAFANLNAIGLQNIDEYAVRSCFKA